MVMPSTADAAHPNAEQDTGAAAADSKRESNKRTVLAFYEAAINKNDFRAVGVHRCALRPGQPVLAENLIRAESA